MLNLFYRVCEKREATHCERVDWFSKEKCLKSFFNAVEFAGDLVHKPIFVHDGPIGPLYEELSEKYEVKKITAGSYWRSLNETYEIASDYEDDIYIIEDDYLHLPDSVKKIALAVPHLKLVTGYDHLSRYNPLKYTGYNDSHYEMKIIFDEVSNHHWRTNESACQTFAIERNAFTNTKHILQRQECLDHDQNLYRSMYHYGYPLWTPLLGLTTQVDPYMSPGFDWEKFNSTL